MSWYSLVKISMPLPEAKGTPNPGPNGYFGGLSDVNHRLTDDHAKAISNQFPGLSYIGDGVDGVAYSHDDPNTVVKITTSANEAHYAEMVMARPAPCCAKVLDVQHNENGMKETWTIVTEKVQLLTEDQRKMVHMSMTMNRRPQANDPESKRFITQFFNLRKCLEGEGIPVTDTHSGNIGFNAAGRLVLFDFGPQHSA